MKLARILPAVVLAAATLTACGGGPDEGAETTQGGLTPIKAGVIPIADTAAVWLGKEKGFFEEEGLDLTIEPIQGGAVAVPGVMNGDYDFAFSNIISMFISREKGLDLRFLTNGTTNAGVEPDIAAVVVPADSPLKTAADLSGKKVSTNILSNIGDTVIRHATDEAGGNGESLKFVELNFLDVPPALDKGDVDAGLIVEPFLSPVLASGDYRALVYPYMTVSDQMDVSGYFTSGQYLEENAEVAEKITQALRKSLEYADEHEDEARQIITTYTEVAPEAIAETVMPRFLTEFNVESARTLGTAALKYGTLSEEPDLDVLLPSGS